MRNLLLVPFAVAAVMLISGCGGSGPALSVSDVQVIAPAPGRKVSVAYFTIRNHGAEPVKLTGITSPQFGRVELHETVLENGIASMRALASLRVDASASIELAPGGKHVMLFEPAKVPLPGTEVTLHFQFASSATLIVRSPLRTRLLTD